MTLNTSLFCLLIITFLCYHPVLYLLRCSCVCSGAGWTEKEVLEVAHSELPQLHQTTAYLVHRDQHHHSDFCSGQVQPQRSAGLRDTPPNNRPHTQQWLYCVRSVRQHWSSRPAMSAPVNVCFGFRWKRLSRGPIAECWYLSTLCGLNLCRLTHRNFRIPPWHWWFVLCRTILMFSLSCANVDPKDESWSYPPHSTKVLKSH